MKHILYIFFILLMSVLNAGTIDVRVASSSDDAVEELTSTNIYADEGQLELVIYPTGDVPQKIGLRFTDIQIPNGAIINNAYLEFRATRDEVGQTDIMIVGENSSNATTYTLTDADITSRIETSASVNWLNVPVWTGGQDYQTVDITSIIQELVDLGGWQAGNAMALMLKPFDANCNTTECLRQAVSFDGDPTVAPLLHIVFNEPATPPLMGDVPDSEAYIDIDFVLNIADYVTETDGDPILSYDLNDTLPAGLELDNVTGVISGMPRVLGSKTISVTATDKDGTSLADIFTINVTNPLVIDYRMDECFWLGSAYKDVIDSSLNGLNGTSYNNAAIDTVNYQMNSAGLFDGVSDYIDIDDDPKFQVTDKISISLWVYPTDDSKDQTFVAKSDGTKGWNIFYNKRNNKSNRIQFRIRIGNKSKQAVLNEPQNWLNNWHFIAVTYDGVSMKLYVDQGTPSASKSQTGNINTTSNPVTIANRDNDQYFSGNLDEIKIWNSALSTTEIGSIYSNELGTNNYNGADRVPVICNATIQANTWEMIGIPAEARNGTLGVQDVFGDDFVGANYSNGLVDGWVLWKLNYNALNNYYQWIKIDYANNETIEFGKGYFLGSGLTVEWDIDGLESVDYNSTYNGTEDCMAKRCVEIDLTSVSSDGLDGSGTHRINLGGFIGKVPINWRDCRFIISALDGSDVEVLTPEEAETAGYASRTISLWLGSSGSGTNGQVLSGDYTDCSDTSPGGCQLIPYHAAWIEVFVPTLSKTVKLLIPEE